MTFPLVGVGVPIMGPHAGPAALETVATAADRLGFHSISVSDRLLLPAAPDWTNDAGLPPYPAYDALETLTWIAAKTQRIRLRTDVLVPLFQQPVVLARRFGTLDHLNGGRVDAGLALGWLPEEFEATGVPPKGRVTAFEENIAALRACWGPDPVEFTGRHYRIPRSTIGPKPLSGKIAIYIGGVAKAAIERAARLGDGCTLACRTWDDTLTQIAWYREAGGTGPLVVRAGPLLPHPQLPTPPTDWTEPSIVEDLARAAEAGVTEVVWELNIVNTSPADQVRAFETLAARIGLEAAPPSPA